MNFKTDADGYLVFANGKPEIVRTTESIKQNIRSRLRTIKGEYFLDNRIGFDYQNGFAKGNKRYLQYEIKKAILSTPGVVAIKVFQFETDATRKATVYAEIQTVEGDIIYRGL